MLQNLSYNGLSFSEVRPFLGKLWCEIFGDSEEFVDAFFHYCASENVLHTLSLNGHVVSVLYTLPYELTYNGNTEQVAYIYAVATDKEYRGRGLMRHLMSQVHESLRIKGYVAALLLPSSSALALYYASMGYRECAYRKTIMLAVETDYEGYTYEKCSTLNEEVFVFIKSYMALRRDNIIHPKSSLAMNVVSCTLSGGGLFIAKQRDTICAAAFVSLEESRPLILEIITYDNEAQNSLVAYLGKLYAVSTIPLLCCDKKDGVPFAMALPFDSSFPETIRLQLMLDK